MEYLFDGVKEFNNNDFFEYKELFEKISRNQTPHTLFIGCSDSRVVPNLITKALPGDLFVIRNIANIVPPFRETNEFLATTSAIEYAVNVLEVENIVICGHTNCGGCNTLFKDQDELDKIPHTRRWLELSRSVKEKILSYNITDMLEREWKTEQLNIVQQMNHLLTYPYIKERLKAGKINILGWYYLLQTGEVFNYDRQRKIFMKIE